MNLLVAEYHNEDEWEVGQGELVRKQTQVPPASDFVPDIEVAVGDGVVGQQDGDEEEILEQDVDQAKDMEDMFDLQVPQQVQHAQHPPLPPPPQDQERVPAGVDREAIREDNRVRPVQHFWRPWEDEQENQVRGKTMSDTASDILAGQRNTAAQTLLCSPPCRLNGRGWKRRRTQRDLVRRRERQISHICHSTPSKPDPLGNTSSTRGGSAVTRTPAGWPAGEFGRGGELSETW